MPDLSPDIERELDALDDALAGRRVAPDLTELGELALLLREERPQATDDYRRELDARAARGFEPIRPAGARARSSSGRRWKALFSIPAMGFAASLLVVAVIVVVAGTSGSDDEAGTAGGGAVAMESAPDTGSTAGGSADGAGGSSPSASRATAEDAAGASGDDSVQSYVEPVPPVAPAPDTGSPGTDGRDNRKVERSASLTLAARPRDIDAVSARIQEVTREQGGFVVSSTVSSSTGGGGGTFQLRIPTRNLDAAMAGLSRLGKVRERAQRSQDITAEAVSARSRLTDAKTERKSLLRQLAAATTTVQTESIRARLRIVSQEIEVARASMRRVDNRASFSTVAVTLVGDRSAAAVPGSEDENGWTPGDAAHDALRVLEVAAGIALIALAIGLPLALLAGLAAFTVRIGRRRRREHALDVV